MGTVLADYDGKQGRGLTWMVFLVFSTLLLMAFSVIPLPSQEFAEQAIEVLLLEHTVFQRDDTAAMEDEVEEIVEETEQLLAEPVEELEGQGDSPDIASFMAVFDGNAAAPLGDITAEMTSRTGGVTELVDGELDVDVSDALGAFGGGGLDLTSGLVTRENAQGRPTRVLNPSLVARGSTTGSLLGGDGPGATGLGIGDGVIGTGRVVGGTDLVGTDKGIPVLKPREVEMEVPTPQIIDWLKFRQSPIDPGIRAHFRYTPDNMTAKERIIVAGQSFGMQLMYAPSSRSLHVALLDGDTVYYFVDPGTRGRANYFQKGTARRDEEGLVVLVETEDFSPRGSEATVFFQIFRGWWDAEDR